MQPLLSVKKFRSHSKNFGKSQRLLGMSVAAMVLTGGLFLLVYFIYNKSAEYITFSAICFSLAIANVLYWNFFDRNTYIEERWNNLGVQVIGYLIGFLYPIFFLVQAKANKAVTAVSLLLLCLSYLVVYTIEPIISDQFVRIFHAVIVFGSVFGIIAIYRFRRIQNCLNLIGTLCLVYGYIKSNGSFYNFINYWLGIVFSLNVTFIVASLVFQMRTEAKEKKQALMKSAQLDTQKSRLELELLKSSIQPHFLMNTLTSVMEWIEESPEKSIQFIDTLAKEFRLLYDISSKSLIPLSQEIELCKSFLEIMRFRKDVHYTLDAANLSLHEQVPPLIIHTLIENSITHNTYLKGQKISFNLASEAENGSRKYIFTTPTTPKSSPKKSIRTGMGLKYIKARLEESYPGKWTLDEFQAPHSWTTTISFETP